MEDAPVLGLYDSLLTRRLAQRVASWRDLGHAVETSRVDGEEVAHLLGRFIGETAARALATIKDTDEQLKLANTLLGHLADPETVEDGPNRLLSVIRNGPDAASPQRPLTSLSEAALLTNAREDPNLAHELAAELASADRVDLLCAFVKWSGLRILEKPLTELQRRGVPLRVITTTYMGATERRALDRLVRDFGAEVRISYEQNATRLHAKAWLLRRRTGFDTAYVGSSNLSRAALLDGLEWNVRLSSVATPRLLDKFEGTFDSYWNRPQFETYDPETDGDRVDEALSRAQAGKRIFDIPALVPHPFQHQRQMLEDLDVQRTLHDRHRNLLVAATGTGKTVVAAFDYRNLQQRLGRQPSLLFVAHRREILAQALRTYRQVLAVPDFGELHVGEDRSRQWRHVFASIQSLTSRGIDSFDPRHFDVVVIDEFHHAAARTYRQVIDHLKPKELLGLTATPERADGTWVHDEFFDGRIASELRLWDALDADLLCPFHYFGINDETDFRSVAWSRGAYLSSELDNILTGDTARARLVFNALLDKASDLDAVRGLGFCISVRHAHFMADFFTQNGLPSLAVDGSTDDADRRAALSALRDGKVTFLFAVDLFNEGLDVPDVNTLLLLRPTESATVFLQQLGRGLRRTPDKDVLTVLDFVGQHRKEYRFATRFQALTGHARGRLEGQVKDDFPLLPTGSQIVLDRVTKDRLLAELKIHLNATVTTLSQEIRSCAETSLIGYLEASGRDIGDVYRNQRYWTSLLRRAGLVKETASPMEEALGRRVRALLHVDDQRRADAYIRLLRPDGPEYDRCSPADQAFIRMLFFSFWRDGGGFASYGEGLARLRAESALCAEIQQVIAYGVERPRHVAKPLPDPLEQVPLAINAHYSSDEILAGLGWAALGGPVPSTMREGVAWIPATQCDALLVTLRKNEKEFSPQTMYRDFALTPSLFHWESQYRTSAHSSTGLRYQNHERNGSHVLLFTREGKENESRHPEPFVFHGTARYVEHRGERPMAVTWKLDEEMPTDLFRRAAIAG
ncbi:DEAD/DEAH box helicase [Planotetraspora phitsanulokensis]|uniref:Helicase n=1 Tax=Planotetraspora phitsanulokensis TaxID=575192 RepID=A0A8J3UFX7_9ACTN|nr:DEAD/DEAH box helicase [Planotetraspora phitsanulokensis]GII41624.1 helicase [Planotetraspora phitsanulokensis]